MRDFIKRKNNLTKSSSISSGIPPSATASSSSFQNTQKIFQNSSSMWSSQKGPTRLWDLRSYVIIFSCTITLVLAGNEIWPLDRPDGMPTINSLEVMCGKDHMDVHLSFSHPFEGIVSSKGQHSDPRCVYVPPSTGKTFFSFRIAYGRCGTKPDLHGQFYENTVVVQYDKDLLEVWDEAKRLRCEWFNDYEKTASKPPMVIADLDVIQLDFRGDNVDCWMEIQHGKGPWAPPVSGIVPLGSTLTLVVAINDYKGEFDMRVKSCVASDGGGHSINLSDEFGCVLRPKMLSKFLKARAPDERATVITYAFFHAFKFPDALSVHIKCKVEICRHGCLDHCQHHGNIHERKDTIFTTGKLNDNYKNIKTNNHETNNLDQFNGNGNKNNLNNRDQDDNIAGDDHRIGNNDQNEDGDDDDADDDDDGGDDIDNERLSNKNHGKDIFYDDIIHEGEGMAAIGGISPNGAGALPLGLMRHADRFKDKSDIIPAAVHEEIDDDIDMETSNRNRQSEQDILAFLDLKKLNDDQFPHGPRYLEAKDRMGMPAVAGPRSLRFDDDHPKNGDGDDDKRTKDEVHLNNTNDKRKRRSIIVSDRKARSADVGVSGIYEVISEADLAFSPEHKQEAVTVFQGKISEEVVYGICMPVPGFSVLFIVISSAAIVSALIAGSLLYRYQLQKETLARQKNINDANPMNPHTIASWMTMRLFRMRQTNANTIIEQQHQPPQTLN